MDLVVQDIKSKPLHHAPETVSQVFLLYRIVIYQNKMAIVKV